MGFTETAQPQPSIGFRRMYDMYCKSTLLPRRPKKKIESGEEGDVSFRRRYHSRFFEQII